MLTAEVVTFGFGPFLSFVAFYMHLFDILVLVVELMYKSDRDLVFYPFVDQSLMHISGILTSDQSLQPFRKCSQILRR